MTAHEQLREQVKGLSEEQARDVLAVLASRRLIALQQAAPIDDELGELTEARGQARRGETVSLTDASHEAPSRDECLQILRGLRNRYETHYECRVEITDDALTAAVELADRHISDRSLPETALDLIDHAASHVPQVGLFQPAPAENRDDALRERCGDRSPGV